MAWRCDVCCEKEDLNGRCKCERDIAAIQLLPQLGFERDIYKEALENISCGDLELGESHPLARIARTALNTVAEHASVPDSDRDQS